MHIVFIQTGGTIDKDYPKTTKAWAFEIGSPAVERILKKLYPAFTYEIIPLLKKDSLEITTEDRQQLLEFIQTSTANKFIISHGTDTMIETASFLKTISNKSIVLTGAMRPEKFSDSDAPINIGVAIGALNLLSEGTYIAMSGRILHYDLVKRNNETGQFILE